MKKQLFLTPAMAATLASISACSAQDEWSEGVVADQDTRVCVDQNGQRIDDDYCDNRSRNYVRGSGAGWYYIGRASRLPYLGDSVKDPRLGITGSSVADPAKSYARAPSTVNMTRSTAVSRGGFGSSSRSFGGGRS